MKVSTQYNDLQGSVAADISDTLGGADNRYMKRIAGYFKLDQDRFEIVGLSIYGTDEFYVSLVCVDKQRSSSDKEHIVKISCNIENRKEILDILFKRLHIVLHGSFDRKYPDIEYDEELRFEDFHKSAED